MFYKKNLNNFKGWSNDGIFNIEGGCYAKCINLSEEKEPDIYRALKFGAVLENIEFTDEFSREVDYDNGSGNAVSPDKCDNSTTENWEIVKILGTTVKAVEHYIEDLS